MLGPIINGEISLGQIFMGPGEVSTKAAFLLERNNLK